MTSPVTQGWAAVLPKAAAFDSVPRTVFPQCHQGVRRTGGNVATSDSSKPPSSGKGFSSNQKRSQVSRAFSTGPALAAQRSIQGCATTSN